MIAVLDAGDAILTVGSVFYLFGKEKDGPFHYGFWLRDDRYSYEHRYCCGFTLTYLKEPGLYAFLGSKSYRDCDKLLACRLRDYWIQGTRYSIPHQSQFSVFCEREHTTELAGHAMVFGKVVDTFGTLEEGKLWINRYPSPKSQYLEADL